MLAKCARRLCPLTTEDKADGGFACPIQVNDCIFSLAVYVGRPLQAHGGCPKVAK